MDVGVEVPESLHLEVLEQPFDALHAAEERRDDDHRSGALGDAPAELETREPAWRDERGDETLHEERGELARRDQRQERRGEDHGGGSGGPDVFGRRDDAEPGHEPDGTEVRRRRVGEEEPAEPLAEARMEGHVDLEALPSAPDQVIADVRGTAIDLLLPGGLDLLSALARALDRSQRDAHLRLARRLGELLHGLPIAVAALEVHPRVDRRRVPPQDLLDETDPLHVSAPVERRAEPEARDRVAGGGLVRGLALVLGPDDVLGRRSLFGERLLHEDAERGDALVVLAQPVPHLGHEGAVERHGKTPRSGASLQGGEGGVRL